MKRGNHLITTEYIPVGEIVKADLADEVVEKLTIQTIVPSGDTVKWIADSAYTIVHVSFHNLGASAFTSAASVTNAGNTVVSSSATLAADTVEEKEGTDLSNTSVADGAEIDLNAGDQDTFIVVTMTKKVNA